MRRGAVSSHTVESEQRIMLSSLMGFLPKQWQAWEAIWSNLFVLFGGARGPGKSRWLRWSLLGFLLRMFVNTGIRGIRVGLFCETYPELRDRQISKIALEFPDWLGTVTDTQEDGLCFAVRDEYGGGRLCLRNLDDPSKYKSSEFAAMGVDELTLIPYETFTVLRGSLRWPGISHRPFLAATNPGGIGHAWVKSCWIDRLPPTELRNRMDEFAFIPALPRDNPYLDEAYWEELNSLPDYLRRAWVDGDWNVFEGQAFSGWRPGFHNRPPFTIPAHWPKWRAIDWGYAKPFCCLWLAKNPDNSRHYVYREAYAAGLSDRQQATLIVEMTPKDEAILYTLAPPELWAKKAMRDLVTSTATEYAAGGVPLVEADNRRIDGKRKVDRMLMSMPDGEPGLVVFDTCYNLIRTLPALPYDKVNVEDVDTEAEDHAYDALRYGLSKYAAAQAKKEQRQVRRAIQSGLL